MNSARNVQPSTDGQVPGKRRRNVLFILADDLGYGDLGSYGNARIRTPHLDKLASQGARLTHFYASSPVCTPSRATFMTGQHPQRMGVYEADVPETTPRFHVVATAIGLPRLLQEAGYRTAHFGKWHLGEPPLAALPRNHGFDVFFGTLGGRPSSSWKTYARYMNGQFVENETQPRTFAGYVTDVTTDRVLSFLDEVSAADRPFYVNVWYHAPHEPLSPRVAEASLYPGLSERERTYYGTVTNLDSNIGRILTALEEKRLADDTLVIFSSDNGPEPPTGYSAGSTGPLRGYKTQLWEGGIRVPLIARLPGVIESGRVHDAVATAFDYVPTICNYVGFSAESCASAGGGRSLMPLLARSTSETRQTLFWEYHGSQRQLPYSATVVARSGDLKLHYFPESGQRLLFDVKNDPAESADLSAQYPEMVEGLGREAEAWRASLPPDSARRGTVPTPANECEANLIRVPGAACPAGP